MTATCTYVGPVAETLGNGRPVAPGETVENVDLNDPHNARLLEQGWLIQHPKQTRGHKSADLKEKAS